MMTFDLDDFDVSEELQPEDDAAATEQSKVESLVDDMADSDQEEVSEVEEDAFALGNFSLDDDANDKQPADTDVSSESEQDTEVTLAEDSSEAGKRIPIHLNLGLIQQPRKVWMK